MSKDNATGIDPDRVSRLSCADCQKTLDVSHLPPFSEIKCPECGTRQIVPAQFGGFLLVSKLGAGGMGVIYHAMDKELGRPVALKVMKKSLGDNEEFVQSFKHEAQAAAALNHRNVVQIYSFGQFKGQPYIVMELVGGGRLDEMIAGGKKMEEARALAIHLEVTEGLRAASDVGLIHSDIKPANILFGQSGEAKVVDFGLASFVGQQQQGGQIWGTPYYIAPEKARGKKVDFRSDIYSLGATLFHVLAGQPPFDGTTPTDVVLARLNRPAPNLRELRDDVHPETAALVARMLEAEPSMRYPSYPALLVDMRGAYNASRISIKKPKGSKAVSMRAKTSSGTPAPRRDFRKILKVAGIAAGVLFVLAGAAGGWIVYQKQQARKAAELAAQESFQGALESGERAWSRTGALYQHIIRNAEKIAPMEERLFKMAEVIQDRNPAPTAALLELDNLNAYLNEAEDLFGMSWIVQQDLALTEDVEVAEKSASQLESFADRLAVIYQAVDQTYAEVEKRMKDTENVHSRVQASIRQARQRAAEAAARRREEAEARKRAEAEAREAELRRPLVLQQEFDRIDKIRGENASLVVQRRFKDAARSMENLQEELTQPETQAYYRNVIETYQQLDKLMGFLIKSINAAPYPQGWSTSGGARDIVGADQENITVSLGMAGAIQVKWEQVALMQVLNIGVYYLRSVATLSPSDRANLIFSLALLCYESAAFKQTEMLIGEALKINPELRTEIDRLMPGLD